MVIIKKINSFLYASNEQVEFKMQTVTFVLELLKNKILRYKSHKYIQDLQEENYKTSMEDI